MAQLRPLTVTTSFPAAPPRTVITVLRCLLVALLVGSGTSPGFGEDPILAFAVVTDPPIDTRRVTAKVSIDGVVEDLVLLPTDQIASNPLWKKLEICHALKLEGHKGKGGFHVTWVRVLDSAMLPMSLQGVAGDCLLKKALEIAPFVD